MRYEHECVVIGGLVSAIGVAGIIMLPVIYPKLWLAALPVVLSGLFIAGDGGSHTVIQLRREMAGIDTRLEKQKTEEISILQIIRYWKLNKIPTDRRTSCERIPGCTQTKWKRAYDALGYIGARDMLDKYGAWRVAEDWTVSRIADALREMGYE